MHAAPFPLALFVGVALIVCLFVGLAIANGPRRPVSASDAEREHLAPDTDSEPAVDPWQMQLLLMLASDQEVPVRPTVTKTTLLYWALCLEEMAEMSEALVAPLMRAWFPPVDSGDISVAPLMPTNPELVRLYHFVNNASDYMHRTSAHVRDVLKTFDYLVPIDMLPKEAVLLLDGTTDVAVVNSGFCLAAGLPGSRGYLEVQTSNLSKRNAQGKIDKDPSGKWIKGPGYVEPSLSSLFAQKP